MNAMRSSWLKLELVEERCQPSFGITAPFHPATVEMPESSHGAEFHSVVEVAHGSGQEQVKFNESRVSPSWSAPVNMFAPRLRDFTFVGEAGNSESQTGPIATETLNPPAGVRLLPTATVKSTRVASNGIAVLTTNENTSENYAADLREDRFSEQQTHNPTDSANATSSTVSAQFATPFAVIAAVDLGDESVRPDRVIEPPVGPEMTIPQIPTVDPAIVMPSVVKFSQVPLIPNGIPLMGAVPLAFDALQQSGRQLLAQLEKSPGDGSDLSTLEEYAWQAGGLLVLGSAAYVIHGQKTGRRSQRVALGLGVDLSEWEPSHD